MHSNTRDHQHTHTHAHTSPPRSSTCRSRCTRAASSSAPWRCAPWSAAPRWSGSCRTTPCAACATRTGTTWCRSERVRGRVDGSFPVCGRRGWACTWRTLQRLLPTSLRLPAFQPIPSNPHALTSNQPTTTTTRCIECIPSEHLTTMLDTFNGQIVSLSMHSFGCRVVQRILEHCGGTPRYDSVMGEVMTVRGRAGVSGRGAAGAAAAWLQCLLEDGSEWLVGWLWLASNQHKARCRPRPPPP